jgi:chromosomal replication initiation ATPase DnaA
MNDIVKKANDLLGVNQKIHKAINAACLVCNITDSQFSSEKRLRHFIDARRMVYFYCRNVLGMHWTDLGKYFDKNHATALHHCKQHKQLVECDKFYQNKYNEFLLLISGDVTQSDIQDLIDLIKEKKKDELKSKSFTSSS